MPDLYYEYQSGGSLIPLTILGEHDGAGGVLPLQTSQVGDPAAPQTPLAPMLVATQTSRTTADLAWTPAAGFTGPAIVTWQVEGRTSTDNGASFGAWAAITGSPFTFNVFATSLTGLAVGTPEVIFEYRARGENGDGDGAWSPTASFQFSGAVVNVPNRPNNLVYTNLASTSVRLSWTLPTAGEAATKTGLWSGDTNLNIDIDKFATFYDWTGLTPGLAYNNINVRRFNSAGWSAASNWLATFTPPRVRLTTDDPVMGQSVPDGQTPHRTTIAAIRVYNAGDVISKFNQFSPRVVAYTAPGGNGSSMSIVTDAENVLQDFYQGSGSQTVARQNCEMHMCGSNEIDVNFQSGTLPQAVIDVHSALRDLVHSTTGGVRDYPKASVWVDMTANNIRTNGSGPRLKPIAKYLDGFACSMYPAGRTVSATNNIEYDPSGYPPGSLWSGNTRNAYTFYIDPVFTTLNDWRQSGGTGLTSIASQLNQFATWEVGTPIHHSLDGDVPPWVRSGATGTATDLTQKPRYLVGGARTSGPADQQYNFFGFLPYIQSKCDQIDVSMREQIYWNQQSNVHIPNLWDADFGLTSPDSVTAWYQWTPGFRLSDI